MVFMGRGFTSGRQELGSVFSAAVCKIQASKRYIESLPLVVTIKRSCFSQGERLTVQLPIESGWCVRYLIGVWKPSIVDLLLLRYEGLGIRVTTKDRGFNLLQEVSARKNHNNIYTRK